MGRPLFWQIHPVWAFYLLAAIALGVFGVGLYVRIAPWKKNLGALRSGFHPSGIKALFTDGLLGKKIWAGDVPAGLMHFLIFAGFLLLFLGTLILSADHYLKLKFLQGAVYLWYSACLEVAGVMLLAGLVWAAVRRYLQRVPRLENRPEDALVLFWLGLAAFSGFLIEALRLAAMQPDWRQWSFIGDLVSRWFDPDQARPLYPYFWWLHAFLSLGLVAYIPFSKLFHVLGAPAAIYLKEHPVPIVPVDQRTPGGEVYFLQDQIAFDACTRCGRCVDVCPATLAGEPFSPRDFLIWRRAQQREKYASSGDNVARLARVGTAPGDRELFRIERIWHCTTCRACVQVCPLSLSPPDAIRQARSGVVEEGTQMPSLLAQSLKYVFKYNNPWEATKKKRSRWSDPVTFPDLTEKDCPADLCYFVGCTTSMDTRAQGLARALVRVLTHAGVAFGTLGNKEPCCGDIARRGGEDGLFEMKLEETLDMFDRFNIREIITSSPHCFHTLAREYPLYQSPAASEKCAAWRVRHYSALLWDLIQKGALRFDHVLKRKVTYHDPCYLGRHNGIFDVPRRIITAVPGVDLVEMAHCRADSLCCGGGGDRMWQEELDGEVKISSLRIKEAQATGAQLLITACPLCLIMLEDGRKAAGLESQLQVLDLNEFLLLALGLADSDRNEKEREQT